MNDEEKEKTTPSEQEKNPPKGRGKRRWISSICIALAALLIFSLLFAAATRLCMPKYTGATKEGRLIGEYYAESKIPHDVILVGDCEVYESVIPAVLWEEYGISAYVRGSAQQLAWQSYYILEETLNYETPKAVIFNVLSLKYGEPQNEAYNRMTLDGMKWSSSKAASVSASMTEEEDFITYIFPLLRFHSRWSSLTSEDFTAFFDYGSVSHSGYLMQKGVVPDTSSADTQGEPLLETDFPVQSMEYLEKMRTLCEERGIELILMKAPTNNWKYWWYDEWDEQISDYAEEHDLRYFNFIAQKEKIGLDMATDTYDAGIHLNVYGAEKFTRYLGQALSDECGLTDRRADADLQKLWTPLCEKYQNERNG